MAATGPIVGGTITSGNRSILPDLGRQGPIVYALLIGAVIVAIALMSRPRRKRGR